MRKKSPLGTAAVTSNTLVSPCSAPYWLLRPSSGTDPTTPQGSTEPQPRVKPRFPGITWSPRAQNAYLLAAILVLDKSRELSGSCGSFPCMRPRPLGKDVKPFGSCSSRVRLRRPERFKPSCTPPGLTFPL